MSQKNLMFNDKKRKLWKLAKTNVHLVALLRTLDITEFVHIDHKCALFRAEGYDSYEGKDCYLKYIVNPRNGVDDTGNIIPLFLQEKYRNLVLRGIRVQHDLRDVNGVQFLSQDHFVNDIIGLVGMLELVEGFNLGERAKVKRNLSSLEEKLKVIEEFEEIIKQMHNRGYVHNDIKPGNLLVGFNGPIRVIDFSTASSFADYEKDRKSRLIYGTNGYFDYGSVLGTKRDRDCLALGVTLARLLLDLKPEELLAYKTEFGIVGFELRDFERINGDILKSRFNDSVCDYFKSLMNRHFPYNADEFDININPRFSRHLAADSTFTCYS